ncbi:MAG: hypothetical protein D6815_02375, partial [Candidatus Dadabacteria bacterium]
ESAAAAVLANPVYRALSDSLGGAQAYMALQRLYELTQHGDYDVVFVDTPPAAHAGELLSAPMRLGALIETGAASVLANPAILVARAGSAVARAGIAVLLGALERLTGSALRAQVAEFVVHFEQVLRGLSQRAGTVEAMLRRPDTAFVQVVRPRMADVQAAARLRASLAERGIQVGAVVVNRLTPPPGDDRTVPRKVRLAGAPPGTLEAVGVIESELDSLRAAEATAVRALRASLWQQEGGAETLVSEVASLEHDVADRRDLEAIARALFGPHPDHYKHRAADAAAS